MVAVEPEWLDGEEVFTVYRPTRRMPTMRPRRASLREAWWPS